MTNFCSSLTREDHKLISDLLQTSSLRDFFCMRKFGKMYVLDVFLLMSEEFAALCSLTEISILTSVVIFHRLSNYVY